MSDPHDQPVVTDVTVPLRDGRHRGVVVYPFTDPDIIGLYGDRYALLVHNDGRTNEVRMVHDEGVSYLVTADKPWTWNDYDSECPAFTPADLIRAAVEANVAPLDLADWVADRNKGRLESNFYAVYHWAVQESGS